MKAAMKHFYTLVLALVLTGGMLSTAQTGGEKLSESAAAEAAERPAVPQLLSEATYLTKKKPNLKAKYYIFLRSMSWCVPCHMFCPVLFKDYGKMKSAKAELVFLGQEKHLLD